MSNFPSSLAPFPVMVNRVVVAGGLTSWEDSAGACLSAVAPDLWQIGYAVTKRRKGRAPEGSGVPVGTEYHWYILAHQNVAKQTANDYTTSLTGLKFKIAHKRAGTQKWSATPRTQRKRMITFLRNVLADLEKQSAHDVKYLRYWVDEGEGRVFCLVDAPSKEAAERVHRESHGLVADEIYEVVEGS